MRCAILNIVNIVTHILNIVNYLYVCWMLVPVTLFLLVLFKHWDTFSKLNVTIIICI